MNLSLTGKSLGMAAALILTKTSVRAQSAAELMAKGDVSDRTFHATEALKSYLPAERMDPNNVALLLRIVRQYRYLMADATSDRDKLQYGGLALSYGLRAAKLGPNNSDAQLSPAITYGKMLPLLGKKEQVEDSPRIKTAVDRAIQLNPHNDAAWHVLGRWHQSLANVSGLKRSLGNMLYGKLPVGTNEESVACFRKAIAINPNRLRHYIEIGRTYAQMEEYLTARKFIEKGLAMPNVEKDDTEMKLRGREALAKLP